MRKISKQFLAEGRYSAEGRGLIEGTATIQIAGVTETGRCVAAIHATSDSPNGAPLGAFPSYLEAMEVMKAVIRDLKQYDLEKKG